MTNGRIFLLGAAAGAVLTALATDAVPRMMASMMQKMMSHLAAEGGPSEM